jgi:hypothetical protein
VTSTTGNKPRAKLLCREADLEELLRREAKPGSTVLSVFLDTDQSRVRDPAAESLQEYGNIGAFLWWQSPRERRGGIK